MTDVSAGRGGVGIRLYVTGGEVVRRTFDQVGDSGRKMWAEIAVGERSANPAIRALSTGVNQAKGGVGALASQAGAGAGALSAFGAAGVAAAAALGAVAIAGASLREKLSWAAELTDAADHAGETTEALQALRYAADETGVPIASLEGGLLSLNNAIGAMQNGLGNAKIKKAFAELNITEADLKGVRSASDLLPLLADRISKVDGIAARTNILKSLKIAELEPLLRGGADGLRRMTEEGTALVGVQGDVVEKLDETERALERNQQQIDANVTKMQASLAPFFLWLSNMTAKAVTGLVNLLTFSESERLQQAIDTRARIERGQRANGRPLDAKTQGIYDAAGRVGQRILDDRARRASAAGAVTDPDVEGGGGGGGGGPSRRSTNTRDTDAERQARLRQRLEAEERIAALRAAGDDRAVRAEQERQRIVALTEQYRSAGYADAEERATNLVAAEGQAQQIAEDRKRSEEQARDRAQAEADAKEATAQWTERQYAAELEIAHLRGDDALIQRLEREAELRRRIAEYVERFGLAGAGLAVAEQLSVDQARADGEIDRQSQEAARTVVDIVSSDDAWRAAGDAFRNAAFDGLEDMLAQLFSSTAKGEGAGGGWMNAIGNWVSSFVSGGGKAGGGDVRDGFFYRVNEHGAELALLGAQGQVVSAGETRRFLDNLDKVAAGGAHGARAEREVLEVRVDKSELFDVHVRNVASPMVRASEERAVGRAVDVSRRAAPGLQQRMARLGTT